MALGVKGVRVKISGDDEATEVIRRVERELQKLDAGARKTAGGMNQLRQSSQQMGGGVRQAGTQLQGMLSTMGKMAGAVVAYKALGFAKNVLDEADAIGKLAQKTGAAVGDLSVLQHGANLAGVSSEGFESSLKRLSKTLGEFKRGSGEGVAAFRALGISADDLEGKDITQTLVLISEKFAQFADGPEKAEAAMKIFGRQGADLIPLLNDLANGGFARLNDEVERLGTKHTPESVKAATDFKDALTRLGGAVSGLLIAFAPVVQILADFARGITDVISGVRRLIALSPRASAIAQAALAPFKALSFVLSKLRKEQEALEPPGESADGDKPTLKLAGGRNAAQKFTETLRRINAELAAQKAFNQLAIELERDRYQQGLVSAQEFYTRRREIAEEESAKELAALDAERAGAGRKATAEQLAAFESRRQQIETAREREILGIERERLATIQQLSSQALDFSGQAAEARGDTLTHELAKVTIAAEQYRRTLEQLGASESVIEDVTDQFERALTLRVKITDEQRKAARVLAEIAGARDRIQADVDRGVISQSEGERRILALERSRKTELQAVAREMIKFAEELKNPELLAAARALAGEIEGMGVNTDAAGKALTNLKDSIGSALVSDLSNFFSSTILQAENLGDAFIRLAADIVGSIQRIISQIIALKIVQSIGLSVPGFASGGYVWGPGTSTSDSIPARLSRGEFVVNAKATKQFLPFLRAINGSALRRPRPRRFGIQRFNTGGLVEGAAAAGSGTPASGKMEALIGLEPGLLMRHLRSTEGMRTIVEAIGANPRAVRAILGL